MFRLDGKVAVVTGGAKGIGRGMAQVFAQAGAKVAVLDLDEEAGRKVVEAIRKEGGEALFLRADVARFPDLEAAAAKVEEAFGGTDILLANAGIYPQAFLLTMEEADWERVMAVNLKGMFLTVKAFLPLLRRSKAGRIVLTSSITGPITGYPGWSHYGATKAGMLGFMRSAAIELAPYGITVNAVLPGNIATEGLGELSEDYQRKMEATIPLRRLGTPEEVAYAALFLASEEARYITGHALVVDGGQTLPESSLALEGLYEEPTR